MSERLRGISVTVLGILMCLYVLAEVNHPRLKPQSELALFVGFGLVLCFLVYPLGKRFKGSLIGTISDVVLIVQAVQGVADRHDQRRGADRALRRELRLRARADRAGV